MTPSVASPPTAVQKSLLAAICIVTLFFAFITPPFQAPDENQHYMKALMLAQGQVLTKQRQGMIGAELPRSALDLHTVNFPTDVSTQRKFDPTMLAKAWRGDPDRSGTRFADFPNVANYAPTLYAPGAAGLLLGDLVGLPRLGSFYAGRVGNALAGLALLGAALSLIPFGRNALLATALLPTFCYQTGSLSPDSIINGVGFVGLALSLRIAFTETNRRHSVALLIVAPLLALAKGVYLPLLAAGFRWLTWRNAHKFWLIPGAMALGAAIFLIWMKMSGGSQALYHIVSRKTGENVMTAPLAAQLSIVMDDPSAYVRLLCSSVLERTPVYALQIVGRFGWNAILLPLAAYPLAGLMLGAAILNGSGMRISMGWRIWWLAVTAGAALLIETAMYLTATPLGADYIQGTQGRYFLPLLPLALLALMPERGARGARAIFSASAVLLLLIAAVGAFDSFWIHGFVTTDGMPPYNELSRALLLPSPRW